MKIATLIATPAAVLLSLAPASSSTTEAWTAVDSAARGTCEAAITKAHALSAPGPMVLAGRVLGIGGKSNDAYYGVTFLWPTATGAEAWLCLYDKHTAKVQIAEIQPAPLPAPR